MSLVLMVEREVIPGAQEQIKELLRELRSNATRQPGFGPTIFMTISTWSSMASWQTWEADLLRTEIIERIDAVLQRRPRARIWQTDEDAPVGAL